MITFLISFFLVINPINDLTKIARENAVKKQAKSAFDKGDFKTAASHYRILADSFQITEPNVLLNLSHAYYKAGDTASAENFYRPLLAEKNQITRSIANLQYGNIAAARKKYEDALSYYKLSLKADPNNEEARYNYELVKKLLEQQKQEQDGDEGEEKDKEKDKQDNKDQKENKDQQQDKKEDKEEGEKTEEDQKDEQKKEEGKPEEKDDKKQEDSQQLDKEEKDQKMDDLNSLKEKLEKMNMNEETAKMILEALRNQEVQYLQQMRRKPTQKRETGKPDW